MIEGSVSSQTSEPVALTVLLLTPASLCLFWQGTICKDCLYSTFCTSCSWCQMSREMKKRNIQILLVSAKNS